MWQDEKMRAPYALLEVEVTEPLRPVTLAPGEGGAHLLVRHRGRPAGRTWLDRAVHGSEIAPEALAPLIADASAQLVWTYNLRDALLASLGLDQNPPTPSLTIAVCTRNRAELLRRCLAALVAMREARRRLGPVVDILVVDNAPTDDQTRAAAASFPGVRYVVEPVPGLDFARNRALAETERDYLGFIDDDAIVDRSWLDCLAEAVQTSPDASAFTGPVLPLLLETEAQLRFERAGGFGEGIAWEYFDGRRWDDPIYPANAGRLGTGANMLFSVSALRAIGGFDEALDTGPPLPGGGDIDSYYRIVRAGHRLVYVPGLLVHHEHRREMKELRNQYYSWGLSVMVVMRKNGVQDPQTRPEHRRLLRWWLKHYARRLARALLGRGPHPPGFVLADILGALKGYFGEYERSAIRVAARRLERRA